MSVVRCKATARDGRGDHANAQALTCVVGAILFWVIDRFVRDGRLANLLKILVVLVCLAAILQRLLPLFGMGF
jgi:uncharacterized membrane protein YvlD (DUF360 family)